MSTDLKDVIDAAFEKRETVKPGQKGEVADAVEAALTLLDNGRLRVAEKKDGEWIVHAWLKKAVLLSFRLNDNSVMGLSGARRRGRGGTRFRRNSPAGPKTGFAPQAFAPCRGPSCGAPPISRPASFSCLLLSISAPTWRKGR